MAKVANEFDPVVVVKDGCIDSVVLSVPQFEALKSAEHDQTLGPVPACGTATRLQWIFKAACSRYWPPACWFPLNQRRLTNAT